MAQQQIIRERWITTKLEPFERPNLLYMYFVTGRADFPFDMLRFDRCWPATGDDAAKMDTKYMDPKARRQARSIRMLSYKQPEIDRWASFLWSVGNEKV